jgi:tRNA C32,U32 (ribose-2'-O)-methylase TrmJ
MAIIHIEDGEPLPELGFPGIILVNPKFSANVVNVHRLAACFGAPQVWCTGNRVAQDMGHRRKTRLPPEERMRGFGRVDLVWCDRAVEVFASAGARVVGVEIADGAKSLLKFDHRAADHGDRVVYVFGPEDGKLQEPTAALCDVIVEIPAFHSLNLATAVSTVMWDRTYKLWRDQGVPPPEPSDTTA